MAKYLDPPLIATMLVGFVLTYAYLYWQRPPAPRLPPVSSAAVVGTEVPSIPAAAALLDPAPGIYRVAVPRQVPSYAPVVAARADPLPTDDPLPPLPVQISVFNRRQQNKIEGSVQNMSRDHLSLTLRGRNGEGQLTSQAHVELDPEQRKSFGPDSGMTLHEQDDILVQSVGYAVLFSHVP